MSEKTKEIDEEEKEQRGEDPKTKVIGTTKTAWLNFHQISQAINREPQHILDFFKAELDVEGNFGGDNNMILVGKY